MMIYILLLSVSMQLWGADGDDGPLVSSNSYDDDIFEEIDDADLPEVVRSVVAALDIELAERPDAQVALPTLLSADDRRSYFVEGFYEKMKVGEKLLAHMHHDPKGELFKKGGYKIRWCKYGFYETTRSVLHKNEYISVTFFPQDWSQERIEQLVWSVYARAKEKKNQRIFCI